MKEAQILKWRIEIAETNLALEKKARELEDRIKNRGETIFQFLCRQWIGLCVIGADLFRMMVFCFRHPTRLRRGFKT